MTADTEERAPYHILLVEDNPGDVELTKETIKDSDHEATVMVVGDGEPAMAYLRKEGEFADAQRPDIILLDLNLPMKDGLEVLKDMAADDGLKGIPVMILTGTEAEESLLESYNIPVNRFCRKPIEVSRLNDVVRWLGSPSSHHPIVAPPSDPPPMEEKKKKWWWPF